MIGKLNPVGVATPLIDEALSVYRDLLSVIKIASKFVAADQWNGGCRRGGVIMATVAHP